MGTFDEYWASEQAKNPKPISFRFCAGKAYQAAKADDQAIVAGYFDILEKSGVCDVYLVRATKKSALKEIRGNHGV